MITTPAARILIVDDDAAFTRSVVRLIRTFGLSVASVAHTAEEALAACTELSPDVALVDINLRTAADGIQVGRAIANAGTTAVVYMSGALDEAIATHLVEEGCASGCVGKPFSPAELKAALLLAASQRAERARARERFDRLNTESERDPLTQLLNRRGFEAHAERLFGIARRQSGKMTVFSIDLDGLKAINDEHGHAAGDQAIASAGKVLAETFRSTDVVARLGGDEFVVAGMDADPEGALRRLEAAIDSFNATNAGITLRMSVGFAESSAPSDSLAAILDRADAAMYVQKRLRTSRVARRVADSGAAAPHAVPVVFNMIGRLTLSGQAMVNGRRGAAHAVPSATVP
ncbi:MAG: diguanylate cyclase [Deltaproteobacteria bacterium]|nr:diguanylate cyclase [Deltaproteobacteria bacterium]